MAKFKTRARALDMLGRQQIAGIPTAINELFKNAYDAYADKAEIDYFRKERLFILRDNGVGMTREEFETRWLTLGTESKFENKKIPPPPKDPLKPSRPTMGEKGIGRLAIASIGRQVFILSRAKRDGSFQPAVAAFIHWGVFELPNINLEDIMIPVREFESGYLPTDKDVSEMVIDCKNSLDRMIHKEGLDKGDFLQILAELEQFNLNPSELDGMLPGFLTLTENGGGTHFYVSPTSEIINSDIDGTGEKDDATKIEKTLIGFTNPMMANPEGFGIQTAFREYDSISATFKDVINPDEYFSQEDFSICDHLVEGEFDEFGQFKGTVKVYQKEEFKDHLVSWNGNSFRPTECGSFKIKFGYLQGALRQSIVDPENFAILNAKLNKYGGLYIFRDGLRVLPYGNNDYDFILMEKRRNKGAGYYFFSYRRLFGAIEVSRKGNPQLKEKAGREGFIENKSYIQFNSIIQNFFIQLATDFFRESGGGPRTDIYLKIRGEREALHEQLKRRKKQAKGRKEEFRKSLDSFFERFEKGFYPQELEKIVNSGVQKLSRVSSLPNNEDASREIVNTEKIIRAELKEFKNQYKISVPRGFAPFKDDKYRYEVYLNATTDLDQLVVDKGEKVLEVEIVKIISVLGIQISKRKRLEEAVDSIANNSKTKTKEKQSRARLILDASRNQINTISHELIISLDNRIREAQDQFKNLPIGSSEDFDLVKERQRLEDLILTETEKNTKILDLIVEQLESLPKNKEQAEGMLENGAITITALEEEIDDLQAKIHADVELTQLGLAVSVVNHEFGVTVKSIRDGLRNLQSWADVNSNLEAVYNTLRANFDHLDSYLKVFTPLNRRLYRKEESIPLKDIKTFLQELFEARFKRHKVTMVVTNGFTSRSIFGLRSTFYPVFVNLVDNSIYWLSKKDSEEDRVVRLHADDTGFYISNNGPEILLQDQERIFEFGFSRKPNGRGMGLAISREVLEGAGYELIVDIPREKSKVTFKIQPKKK